MAEKDEGQERTESATPKRREEARKQGQVPRSRDLSAAAVTLFSCGAVIVFGARVIAALSEMMRGGLSIKLTSRGLDDTMMLQAVGHASMSAFMAVLPILAAGFVAAILAPMTLSGWNFSTEALVPQFSRLNPISGFGRMFTMNSLIELAKSFAKFGVVAVFAYIVLNKDVDALMAMGGQSLPVAMKSAATLCTHGLMTIACSMLVIAGIDVPLQLWQYSKNMRMTRQEIREESKESEGSPEVKGKIRRMQQEVARRRMMGEVPKADVIVTNPTHFAVALRYDDKRNRAPIVVAKGVDLVAARIREIAAEHKVPIFEAPPLARVLYRSVDLNHDIPASLYTAVAQVLTYIYQLRAYKKGEVKLPPLKPTVDVNEADFGPRGEAVKR